MQQWTPRTHVKRSMYGRYTQSIITNQIKSKLLVLGAVKTTINDQGYQHVTGGGVESIRMFLSKQTGWPTFVHSHPSVKPVERFKKQLSHNLPTLRKGENK